MKCSETVCDNMLERVPKTKAILHLPKHRKHKKMIHAAIKSQTPLLERIRSKYSHQSFDFVVSEMTKEELKFPIAPSGKIISFAESVALAWKDTSPEERKELGLHPDLIEKKSSASSFFGTRINASSSLGRLLYNAEAKRTSLRTRTLVKNLFFGANNLKKIQAHLAETGDIYNFWKTEEGIVLFGTGLKGEHFKIIHPNVVRGLVLARKECSHLLREVAKRMSIGFNPIV